MTTKKRNDFRVFEETTTSGKQVWRIRIGGEKGTNITTLNTLEEANEMARQLNIDPWFAERGQTRKDRGGVRPNENSKQTEVDNQS